MDEPAYIFSLPSLEDDTVLECRLYHPEPLLPLTTEVKGVVLAHPYAPLGGSFDDGVVLSTAQVLVRKNFVVATFNFRGAGASRGSTSWTGHGEQQDFCSVIGFLIYYLHSLMGGQASIQLVLGGYSYGSLVLARLPEPGNIVKRFQDSVLGTSGSEILLRARRLAAQTLKEHEEHSSEGRRGRSQTLDSNTGTSRPSSVKVGGEETSPSDRRRSRDSRRSGDLVRRSIEMPHKIKAHLHKRHASNDSLTQANTEKNSSSPSVMDKFEPTIRVRYLLVSPVLLPFTTVLLPPGPPTMPFPHGREAATSGASRFLRAPTLVAFGSADSFTSSRRLQTWAERQAKESVGSNLEWTKIEGAGHFWHEDGVMQKLRSRIKVWIDSSSTNSNEKLVTPAPTQR